MAKVQALVLRDENGDLYVLPSEYIAATKVDPKSHKAVMGGLADKPRDVKLGGGFSFIGEISLPEGSDLPRASDDVAWPHFLPPTS